LLEGLLIYEKVASLEPSIKKHIRWRTSSSHMPFGKQAIKETILVTSLGKT